MKKDGRPKASIQNQGAKKSFLSFLGPVKPVVQNEGPSSKQISVTELF